MNRFVVVHSLPSYTTRLLISIVCSWLNINYAIVGSFSAFIFRFHDMAQTSMAQTKSISLRYGTVYTTVYSCGGDDSIFLVLILQSKIITYFDWCTVLEEAHWFLNALRTDVTWLKGNFFLFISFYQLLNGFEQLPTDKFDTMYTCIETVHPRWQYLFSESVFAAQTVQLEQVTPHLLINFF